MSAAAAAAAELGPLPDDLAELLADTAGLSVHELLLLRRRLDGLLLIRDHGRTPGELACHLSRTMVQTPALSLVDERLMSVFRGDVTRQMIFLPPQEGKSQRVSVFFPVWCLAQDPTLRIGIVSYSKEKARRWGLQIRRLIFTHPGMGITLRRDSLAADRFETAQGGRVICVGIEGGITGEPVDILIIDDPIRGRGEAESATYRENAWNWWEGEGYPRLSSRGRVILMMTRWNDDDLAGRLLAREAGEWQVLRIRPIRPEGWDGAELYTEDGEMVSVQARAPDYFRRTRALRSPYVWRSEYDQDPVAAEGNLFHRADFRYWWPLPANPEMRHGVTGGRRLSLGGGTAWLEDCFRFVTVDLAASRKTSADWTVASAWAITLEGDLVLLDRRRDRIEESGHFELVRPLLGRWAIDTAYVEAAWMNTTLVVDATKAGIGIQPVYAETDKLTRALPATQRVRAHRVWFPAHVDWLDEWCDELASFPTGAHDDQVDTLAYAARVASAHWVPPWEQQGPRRASSPSSIDEAYAAAVGTAARNGHSHLE